MITQETFPLSVQYLAHDRAAAHCAPLRGHVLGAIVYGARPAQGVVVDCPLAVVDMPVLAGKPICEVWTTAARVLRDDATGVAGACTEDLAFGVLQVDATHDPHAAAATAYARIFDYIATREYAHLLRVWHYLPNINEGSGAQERYVRFNSGRHQAFMQDERAVDQHAPAASALGSSGGSLVVYFLAGRQPGRRIQNPRQVNAFDYPAQYGPRSPIFSRAMHVTAAGSSVLLISGTASIVGHRTVHAGDLEAQARETVANLIAVIGEAQAAGFSRALPGARLLLKVYLRRPEFLPVVRHEIERAFGTLHDAVYLQADICRSDLLLEIEGVYTEEGQHVPHAITSPTGAAHPASSDEQPVQSR